MSLAKDIDCDFNRGCVYSLDTHRPGMCGSCRDRMAERKRQRQRDAYRKARPVVMRETKYSKGDPTLIRGAEARRAAAVKLAVLEIEKTHAPMEPKKKPRKKKQQTSAVIVSMWSRASDKSIIRQKYPTKAKLLAANLKTGSERWT